MKNLIKILLYSLLVLLVVAISVMIYKRSNTPEAEADLTEIDEIDKILADTLNLNTDNFSSEDSMIFDLTGQVATTVGKPEEMNSLGQKAENLPPSGGNLDKPISQNVSNTIEKPVAISLPKSNNTSNTASATKVTVAEKAVTTNSAKATATKSSSTKTATKAIAAKSSTTTKATAAKTSTATKVTAVSGGTSGKFYVVAGSYIMPVGADTQVKKLKKMGYASAIKKSFNNDEYYRAVAGRYESREQADKVVKNLKAKGIPAFIKS